MAVLAIKRSLHISCRVRKCSCCHDFFTVGIFMIYIYKTVNLSNNNMGVVSGFVIAFTVHAAE